MFDELERLQECAELRQLLSIYAESADPEAWQDRVMTLENTPARELTRLHGELLAFDWVEQNTGIVEAPRPGVVARCYRITRSGRRALTLIAAGCRDDDSADRADAA